MFTFQTRIKRQDNFILSNSAKEQGTWAIVWGTHRATVTEVKKKIRAVLIVFSTHPKEATSHATTPHKLQSQGFRSCEIKNGIVCSVFMHIIRTVILSTWTYMLFSMGLLPHSGWIYSILFLSFPISPIFSFTVLCTTLHFILNSYNFNVSHKNIPENSNILSLP